MKAERDSNDARGEISASANHRESFDCLLDRVMVLGVCLDWRQGSTNGQTSV